MNRMAELSKGLSSSISHPLILFILFILSDVFSLAWS